VRQHVAKFTTLYPQSFGNLIQAARSGQVCVKPLKPADPPELGGIVLRGRLGEGGMGTVFYGVTPDGDEVAVKTIRDRLADNSELKIRFEREVEAMGMVQGPRVANLIDADPDAPVPWLASEYIRGLTLWQYVTTHGVLPAALAAALGVALAEALATIHQAGVLHRDLKPTNIILASDGPRVIYFGLAALAEQSGHLTGTNQVLGTPVCMSPEQAISSRKVTAATDVYALGATLAYAAARHYPYEAGTTREIQNAIADPAADPDLSGVPGAILPAIAGMLAYAEAARPTLGEVRKDLADALAGDGQDDPAAAVRRLADITYQEAPGAPDPTPTIPRRERLPGPQGDPRVPSTLVRQAADRLRRDYSASAPF
jgi:serine/threonine protein kinase